MAKYSGFVFQRWHLNKPMKTRGLANYCGFVFQRWRRQHVKEGLGACGTWNMVIFARPSKTADLAFEAHAESDPPPWHICDGTPPTARIRILRWARTSPSACRSTSAPRWSRRTRWWIPLYDTILYSTLLYSTLLYSTLLCYTGDLSGSVLVDHLEELLRGWWMRAGMGHLF